MFYILNSITLTRKKCSIPTRGHSNSIKARQPHCKPATAKTSCRHSQKRIEGNKQANHKRSPRSNTGNIEHFCKRLSPATFKHIFTQTTLKSINWKHHRFVSILQRTLRGLILIHTLVKMWFGKHWSKGPNSSSTPPWKSVTDLLQCLNLLVTDALIGIQ